MNAFGPSLLIDIERLRVALGDACGRFTIDAIDTCASTSTLLLERSAGGAQEVPSGSVIVCDRQSAGRGSRGRHWAASPEASLTFSVLWDFAGGLAAMSGLSLGVGLAVVRALASCGVAGVSLKWPNDILYRDAKLGGILVELSGDAELARAVVGIGLNLSLPAFDRQRDPLMMPVTALAEIVDRIPERNRLLAALLKELAGVFDTFSEAGFAALREDWQACHAWQGRKVRVLRNGVLVMQGLCRGADAEGVLLVDTGASIERCLSGDVSLRAGE